jgi:hypothetical protein
MAEDDDAGDPLPDDTVTAALTTAEQREFLSRFLSQDRRSLEVRMTEWACETLAGAGFPTEAGYYAILRDGSVRKAVPEDAAADPRPWTKLLPLDVLARERSTDRLVVLTARLLMIVAELDASYRFFGPRLDEEEWKELFILLRRVWSMGDLWAEVEFTRAHGKADRVGAAALKGAREGGIVTASTAADHRLGGTWSRAPGRRRRLGAGAGATDRGALRRERGYGALEAARRPRQSSSRGGPKKVGRAGGWARRPSTTRSQLNVCAILRTGESRWNT